MEKNDRTLSPAPSDFPQQSVGLSPSALACGDQPTSYEQVTRQGLDDLRRQVDRIEQDVKGLLFGVTGAILIELYRTIVR